MMTNLPVIQIVHLKSQVVWDVVWHHVRADIYAIYLVNTSQLANP